MACVQVAGDHDKGRIALFGIDAVNRSLGASFHRRCLYLEKWSPCVFILLGDANFWHCLCFILRNGNPRQDGRVHSSSDRSSFATKAAKEAGALAMRYLGNRDTLVVDFKGAQDWVSEADRDVGTFVRDKISEAYPDEVIFGEEHVAEPGSSGFDWVNDPIDVWRADGKSP